MCCDVVVFWCSADDFLGSASDQDRAADGGVDGLDGLGGGGGGSGEEPTEEDESDDSSTWEEETDMEVIVEEQDENMPKFISLEQLNDTSKLQKLKRHQLLIIGRSLLRDPKFNDCLLGMVQSLVEFAKASSCAIPGSCAFAFAARILLVVGCVCYPLPLPRGSLVSAVFWVLVYRRQ